MAKNLSFSILNEFQKPLIPGLPIGDPTKITIKIKDPIDILGKTKPIPDSVADTPDEKWLQVRKLLGQWAPVESIPKFKNVYAIPYQKILIVKKSSSDFSAEGNTAPITFFPYGEAPRLIDVRVLRVCEFDNPDDEYGEPTVTVLIEWKKQNPAFGRFDHSDIVLSSQTDNLVIQDPPYSQPGPPVTAALEDTTPDGFSVRTTDFSAGSPEGDIQFSTSSDPVIAVVDTGIKTSFEYHSRANGRLNITVTNEYPPLTGSNRKLKLAEVPRNDQYKKGYCSVTEYLRASKESKRANVAEDRPYIDVTEYTPLTSITKNDIKKSPYDDHLLHKVYKDKHEMKGRHGTTISALINQKSNTYTVYQEDTLTTYNLDSTTAILPVKVFNQGGNGTLFDVLCGLTYVLDCHQVCPSIKVVNLSFAGILHQESYSILRNKFVCLNNRGIWAIAAAGNRGKELIVNFTPGFVPMDNQELNLFPACFSNDKGLNVITVTSVHVVSYKIIHRLSKKRQHIVWPLTPQKHTAILNTLNIPWRAFTIVPASYEAIHNYSKDFVNVGVVGPFDHVFKYATKSPDLHATSFTAALFSAKLAAYLKNNPTATRAQALADLTFTGTIEHDGIQEGRLIHYT
ncbi:hypothetical protein GCM10028808_31140 [Spirosoma migulaei]